MHTLLPALLLSFVLVCLNTVKDPDWHQIKPLQSTRGDVEHLLGPSNEAYYADYTLEEGNLFIEYSNGPCRPDRKGGWNVPKDVVVKLNFSPKQKRKISELKLDPKKFRRVAGEHVQGVFYYINDEEGITYEVQQGRVDEVYYEAPRKYEYLYCGDSASDNKYVGLPIYTDMTGGLRPAGRPWE